MAEQLKDPVRIGRPRSERVHQLILDTALDQVFEYGFRMVTVESIAATAGVGKTTIYRRWPNKAAVVMDAFLAKVGPRTGFPQTERAIDSIRLQMRAQSKAFRGKYGGLIKTLLGEAQFDLELAEAFRNHWILPRRAMARETIERAMEQGDLRPDINPDATIDLLYAPVYYRLQIGTGSISEAYVEEIFEHAMAGLRLIGSEPQPGCG